MGLRFRLDELQQEILVLSRLAEGFIAYDSGFRLIELESQLKGLPQDKPGFLSLQIPLERPLKTRPSAGEFEPLGKNDGREVYAELSGVWELQTAVPAMPKKKKGPKRPLVAFTGLASLAVRLFHQTDASCVKIGSWKMELGDQAAPGCYFHTHAGVDHVFPIPRHPSLFVTPMSAIEFVLGELFQAAWRATVEESNYDTNIWRSIQSSRWSRLLAWMAALAADTQASPWMTLKAAKPQDDLFVSAEKGA